MAQTTTKPTRLKSLDLRFNFLLSLAYFLIGPFAKFTSLWPINRPPLRWTCTWNFQLGFTPSTGIPRITSSSTCKYLRAKASHRVWNSYLVTKLREINFKQSLFDDCVFYRHNVIFIVYFDNGIFLGPSDQQLRDIINELNNLKLSIEDQGHPADYVGVSIKKLKNGIIELTQRALIDSIISDVALGNSKVKAVPAKVSKILHAHLDKTPFSLNFGYRWVIGKLNYLAQTMRPDIVYATHQLAKYSSNPREPHGEAVLYLIHYLKKTQDLGTCFKPDQDKGFECYCNTDFLLHLIQVLPSHKVAGSYSMQDVRSFGHPSCRHKLLYVLLRLSTLPCLNHYETYFL